MSGIQRPGHFVGKVVANGNGTFTVEAAPEDVAYLTVGVIYEFDATPVAGDSGGQEGEGPQSGG